MKRTQIQLPDPLYDRIKQIAEMNDWPLAEVIRRATELYVQRFPVPEVIADSWSFPTIDAGGDYLVDPSELTIEADVCVTRSR
jgi:predicted transcriptional regulator